MYKIRELSLPKTISLLGLMMLSWQVFATEKTLELNDCYLKGIKSIVQCGELSVPENYANPTGEKISVNVAVLSAIDDSQSNAPLMFLAGGPGQAAVEIAFMVKRMFSETLKTRDIILVDQRGTGKSHPLQCDNMENFDIYQMIPEQLSTKEIHDCLNTFSGDLSQYTSENAIRDFDAVRKALGHEKINLYGGSYGTRAALVYMRMFPESLRSVVLDSVGPIEVPIGLFGQSAARSFNLLIENCNADKTCKTAYPNLIDEYHSVIEELSKEPKRVSIPHPRLGTETEFVISKGTLISNLRMQLYSLETHTLVPLIIHQAYLGNYLPLAGLVAQSDKNNSGMYIGLTFNITCNEDFPRINAEMALKDADNTFGKDNSHQAFKTACSVWPKYSVAPEFYTPVTADIPTLILSGNLDPVTPPSNAEYSAKTLPNSAHYIANNVAHIVAGKGCGTDLITEFLNDLSPKTIDATCLDEIEPASFMTNLNGDL